MKANLQFTTLMFLLLVATTTKSFANSNDISSSNDSEMLNNINQDYSYIKLEKNGNTQQMKMFQCHKSECQPLTDDMKRSCFNFTPKTKKEVQMFYRSGLNLMHLRLMRAIENTILAHKPKSMLIGISSLNDIYTTINSLVEKNSPKLISAQVPSILGATNWSNKYNEIRFIGVFKSIMTSPITEVQTSADINGNITEVLYQVPADLTCL